MKKTFYLLLTLIAAFTIQACNKNETYAEKKKKERSAINRYLADSTVNVISEEQFKNQNYTTNTDKNEFVLFASSGVYMQIVHKGVGQKLQQGETATVLVRFTERNLQTDSITLSNNILTYGFSPDYMLIANTSGTFTGSFVQNKSLLASFYGSTAVPKGWLVPLDFVNIGRPTDKSEDIAQVRLIVPSAQGQSAASQNTTPYLYDLTYQRGR